MPGNLNRAQLRDSIRHELNRRTLFDMTGLPADVGNPNPSQPWPSNVEINEALDLVIRNLNMRAGFSVNQNYQVNVVAVPGAQGAFFIDLNTANVPSPFLPGFVNDVRRVTWTDSGGTSVSLLPVYRQDWDRDNRQWQTASAGQPQYYWIEGYQLALWPTPLINGTLEMIVGQGLLSFQSDSDYLTNLPADYSVPYMTYATAAELAGRRTTDVEMISAAQRCFPLAMDVMGQILFWLSKNSTTATPSFAFRSYRQGQGTYRSRR